MKFFTNIQIGKKGEEYAAKYLRKNKYKIVERNYTCISGEIDIIAQKNNLLVFIEVKTRQPNPIVRPALAVNKKKQNKIIKSAFCYINSHNNNMQPRFDVIEVYYDPSNLKLKSLNHIKAAFIQGGDYAVF